MTIGNDRDAPLRAHLLELLDGGAAHLGFEAAVAGFPVDRSGDRPAGLPHSPWELLEHLRICQRDILDFSRSAEYPKLDWPADYWPPSPSPPDGRSWDRSIAAFRQDLRAMRDLVADPATDLLAPLPWGSGQSIVREAMLLADHNAYHLGQLVVVRRLLGLWDDSSSPASSPPEDEG
ncbi:DinB family protein [Tautonia sociabilis]|uniref:DinB family protein n=1 Tax=Tautonia sociabilis TaxID=2080755 RepID=A0A432MP88_9BACT|nr:DinB family protein [Tautonia sociabilis]RUL89251.1 DinB family protein [Tautonia sociabilis]